MYQPSGGRGRSATRQTVSVTEAKSCPPSTSGARRAGLLPVLSSIGNVDAAHPSSSGLGLRMRAR